MAKQKSSPIIPLPRCWSRRIKSVLHVISLAQFGMAYTRGWVVNSPFARMRLKTENKQLRQQVTLLKEEIRTKDGTTSIAPTRHSRAKRPGNVQNAGRSYP